jgi:hypothetical protein
MTYSIDYKHKAKCLHLVFKRRTVRSVPEANSAVYEEIASKQQFIASSRTHSLLLWYKPKSSVPIVAVQYW